MSSVSEERPANEPDASETGGAPRRERLARRRLGLTILWRLHWPSVALVAKYRDLKLRVQRAMMTRPVLTVAPHESLAEAVRLMLENRIGGLPVTAGERLVGILTEVDLLRAFSTIPGVRAGRPPRTADAPIPEASPRSRDPRTA
jgi:CBS domain